MKKILFVIAMEKEAIDLTEELNLKKVESHNKLIPNSNEIYRNGNTSLLIAGMGKELMAINLTQYLENNEKPDVIINMGYAGSTNTKVGTWINISESYNYEWKIPGEEENIIKGYEKSKIVTLANVPELKKLPCYSAECFVTSTDIKEDVLFDMELYSIQLICEMYDIDLISIKKVSDNLSLEDYYSNIDMKDLMELTSGLEYLKEIK